MSESFESNPTARVFGSRKLKASAPQKLHITSDEYLRQKERIIPEEEKFIYQYLRKRTVTAKARKDDSDIDSVCSDEFEKLLDNIHAEDEGKDTLNFAKESGMHKEKKANKRKASDSENESADSVDEVDFEDEDLDDDEIDDEDFKNAFDDIGNELGDEDVCEEDFIGMDMSGKRPKKKSKKHESLSDGQLLAAADEFSALLEENAGSKIDTLSGEAFKVKDKSAAKQIAWEMERNRFVKGVKWQKRKKNFKKTKKFRK